MTLKPPTDLDTFTGLDARLDDFGANVRDVLYGAVGDGVTDDTAAFQAAIDDVATDSRGQVYVPPGDYVINGGLTWPVGKPVRMYGAGNGGSGNIFGTRLKRTSGTTTIIAATGTGITTSTRAYIELHNMELSGGSLAGNCLTVSRASHLNISNVRISNSTVSGAIFKEVWDSATYNCMVENCGNGTTNPALLFDAITGAGNQGGCDTFYWIKPILQANTGTDVKFTGAVGDTAPSNDVEFFGAKLESGSGTQVFIDFDYAKGCAFHGGRISSPTGRSGTFIQQNGTHTDFRPNRIIGMTLDKVGADAQNYIIDHGVGSLHIVGVNFPASAPALGYVRCRSTVLSGRLKMKGIMRSSFAIPLVVDERATNEYIGKERIRMQRQSGTATTGLIGTTPVWDFDPAVAEDFFGNITIPPYANTGTIAPFRFLWTSGTTGGDVVWRVTSQDSFKTAEAVGGAGTAYDIVSTAPGTANQLVTAQTTSGPTVEPGDALQVYGSRNATVGADTHVADARLLSLEVVVDVDP